MDASWVIGDPQSPFSSMEPPKNWAHGSSEARAVLRRELVALCPESFLAPRDWYFLMKQKETYGKMLKPWFLHGFYQGYGVFFTKDMGIYGDSSWTLNPSNSRIWDGKFTRNHALILEDMQRNPLQTRGTAWMCRSQESWETENPTCLIQLYWVSSIHIMDMAMDQYLYHF